MNFLLGFKLGFLLCSKITLKGKLKYFNQIFVKRTNTPAHTHTHAHTDPYTHTHTHTRACGNKNLSSSFYTFSSLPFFSALFLAELVLIFCTRTTHNVC